LRKSFGLISAIIILLLVATLMVAVVKFSFISVKHTGDSYMQQRAELFMQSVIENSLLAIEGYDRKSSGNCIQNLEFTDENGRFSAKVKVLKYYCYDLNDCPCGNAVQISTPKSHGYVLLKVDVFTLQNSTKNSGKKIFLEKTTLQRP